LNQKITIIGLLFLLSFTGCSTEKNTLVTRSYHNLTSRYNIFFNGNENFQQGVKRLEDSHTDDFTRILPIFLYGDPNNASSIAPDMQTAIQKATKVITLHSITVKPEFKDGPRSEKQKEFYDRNEYNIFVPENYLMMGKAYLYQLDFHLAIETFKFILSEYHYDEIVFETQIWLARSYNELGNYDEAYDILEVLTGNTAFPDKLNTDLNVTLADHYMKQEFYERAINPMTSAVETAKKKKDRIRYAFILAQLHQEAGQMEKASEYYRKVIQMNPPYEFSFNSRIKRASVFMAGSERSKEIKDELQKMLKDDKNNDFQDQIYFAIGNVYFREGNVDEALEYYKLSSIKSVSNTQQKTSSCLTIADIYYEQQSYNLADMYYDSAKVYLNESYPGYDVIMRKTSSLGELVQNLHVAQTEDSLQRLAAMDESDRLEIIDAIIMELQRVEQLAREEEMRAMQDQQYNRMALNESQRTGFSADQSGSWYFYNQAAKGFGQPEFRMKWGNRSLEDNWRRSNKRVINFDEIEELTQDTSAVPADQMKILSNKSREFYLQNIPFTDSMMEISHGKIMTALYNAGNIYKNELMDMPKSIATFQDLLDRYPQNDYSLSVYYNLYNLYTEETNIQMANIYKELIVSEFPESQPALILTNPNYAEDLMAEKNSVNRFYEQTYQNYKQGFYERVISDVDTALLRYNGDPLIPKFQFLKVLSIGRTQDILVFTLALDSLIATTTDQEVAESANAILAYILASDEEVKTETKKIEAEEIYRLDSTGNFYFGMILNSSVDINQLKFEIINYNLDHYPNRTFDVVHEVLQNKVIVLFVKQFPDIELSLEYSGQVVSDELISGVLGEAEYRIMIISASNADILLEDGDPEKYWLFFQKHYIR
jgi:tetratricopeptide (TPR) repeat protein